MNARQTYRVALLLLAMLVSHEGITLASNVRQGKMMRQQSSLHSIVTTMAKAMGTFDVDNSFLEMENRHGMSVDAFATHEIREIHKSLKEGFGFENSPILEELSSLKHIPSGKVLSGAELHDHRAQVSLLLEKAMTGLHTHLSAHVGQTVGSGGNCVKTVAWHSTCSKTSECRSDPENPCGGQCVCDTSGVNECTCKEPGVSDVLHQTKEVDKAFAFPDAIGPALFGFVDGFFSGMATEFRSAFNDPACGEGAKDVRAELKSVVHKLKSMWFVMKSVHKTVWTEKGRKDLLNAVKFLMKSLVALLKKGLEFLWKCPATKMLVVMVGIIAVVLMLNVAMMMAGLVVLPLLIKYVGMIMGLYFSFAYMKQKVIGLYTGVKRIRRDQCDKKCIAKVVEDAFGMVGAIAEVVVMSGITEVIEFKVDKNAKSLFKKFGIRWHDTFRKDMAVLKGAVDRAKSGMKNVLKTGSYKTTPADVVSVKVESADNIRGLRESVESGQKHRYTKTALKDAVNEAKKASSEVERARDALKTMEAGMVKKYGEHALDVSKMDEIQKLRINPDDYTKLNNARVHVANAELKSLAASDKAVRSVETIETLVKSKETLMRHNDAMTRAVNSKGLEKAKAMLDQVSMTDVAAMKKQLGNAGVLPDKIILSRTSKKFLSPHGATDAAIQDSKLHGIDKKWLNQVGHDKQKNIQDLVNNVGNKIAKKTISMQKQVFKHPDQWRAIQAFAKASTSNQWNRLKASTIYGLCKMLKHTRHVLTSCTAPSGVKVSFSNIVHLGENAPCSNDVNFGFDVRCVISHLSGDAIVKKWLNTLFNVAVEVRDKIVGWVKSWISKTSLYIHILNLFPSKDEKDNKTEFVESKSLQLHTALSQMDFKWVDGECNDIKAVEVFNGMNRRVDNFYTFACKESPAFCECLVWVGEEKGTVVFTEGEEKLVLKGDGEGVQYEYCPPEGCPASSRRRRLLNVYGNGKS